MIYKKTKIFKWVTACLLFSALSANSHKVISMRLPASEKAIPKNVLETFKELYPDVLSKQWFITHLSYW